jgi:hypothetical protein
VFLHVLIPPVCYPLLLTPSPDNSALFRSPLPIKSFRNAFFSGYGQAQALTIDNISIAKPVVFSNGHLANILKYPLEQNLKKHKISKALPHSQNHRLSRWLE